MTIKLKKNMQKLFICPICKSDLNVNDDSLQCLKCNSTFPVVNGVPILINEDHSLFSIENFIKFEDTTFNTSKSSWKLFALKVLPTLDLSIKSNKNLKKFRENLFKFNETPKVLVIGGSILGEGMENLVDQSIELIESDVSWGPRTNLICDSHDIPLKDDSIDGVVIQAVLEHVVDPYRCINEIQRILKNNGLIYAETPFMQQVHMGKYDFTRFTFLGHRRLFRKFEEIDSGALVGPGTALQWSYQYFLLSFVNSDLLIAFMQSFARITSFWLKYFDYYLIDKPGSLDAASAYYFMGFKSQKTLSDENLIKRYDECKLS